MKKHLFAAALVAAAALAVLAGTASAGNGKLPQATVSTAGGGGSVGTSDGSTPAVGLGGGGFTYNGEAGQGTQTTVIDWQLPAGMTPHYDPDNCGNLSAGGYCIDWGSDCAPSIADPAQVVTVEGNIIHFRLACQSGQGFGFDLEFDSLLTTTGTYDASVQFKTTTLRRANNNMWQIKLPGAFDVSACSC